MRCHPLLLTALMAFFALGCAAQSADIVGQVAGASTGGMKVVALWAVDSKDADYVYKFGEAPVVDGRFALNLTPESLPKEALTRVGDFELGVAMLAVVPAATSLPDGKFGRDRGKWLRDQLRGNAPRHALVFRRGTHEKVPWTSRFSDGNIHCAKAVSPEDGGRMETFAPTPCSDMRLLIVEDPTQLRWVNWM